MLSVGHVRERLWARLADDKMNPALLPLSICLIFFIKAAVGSKGDWDLYTGKPGTEQQSCRRLMAQV